MLLQPKRLAAIGFTLLFCSLTNSETIDPRKFSENARASQLEKIQRVKAENQNRFDLVDEIISKMEVDEAKALEILNSNTLPNIKDKSRNEVKITKSRFSWGVKKGHLTYKDVIVEFDPSSSVAIVELNNYYNSMGSEGWEIGLNEQSIENSRIVKRIRWRKLK